MNILQVSDGALSVYRDTLHWSHWADQATRRAGDWCRVKKTQTHYYHTVGSNVELSITWLSNVLIRINVFLFYTHRKVLNQLIFSLSSEELDDIEDAELDDDDELLTTCSPEPPEPLEMEGLSQEDESSQLGKLDPELDLPYIFKVRTHFFYCLFLLSNNNHQLFKIRLHFKFIYRHTPSLHLLTNFSSRELNYLYSLYLKS